VSDLRSRWNVLLLLVGLAPLFGCMVLEAASSSKTTGLEAAKTTMNFGTVVLGDYTVVTNTLVNSSSSSITISSATISDAEFEITTPIFPLTLAPGQQAAMSITFTPTAAGQPTGTIVLATSGTVPSMTLALSGTAVTPGVLAANPVSVSFGTVMVGKSQTLTETISNAGGTNLTISQATPSESDFQLSGLTLPITLKPGQSSTLNVTFTPTTSGAATGSITMSTQAAGWAHGRRGQYHRASVSSAKEVLAAAATKGADQTLTIALSGMADTAGQLTATSSLNFSTTPVGKSQGLSDTLTNTGGSSVTVSQVTPTGAGFSVTGVSLPLTLAAGQSTSFTVVFAPTSAGTASGNVAVASNASDPTANTALTGTGAAAGSLTASPSSVSFGSVQTGNSQTASETLTNSGGSSVTITQAAATGSGFSVSGITLPVTLAAGQSTSFSVAFAPQTSGAASGSVAVTSNASNASLGIALAGTGVTAGSLTASPSSVSFGSVQTGNSQTASETLTNSGGSSVTVTQAAATGSGFSVSGISLPLTLAAGQSTSFSVAFAPQTSGAASGNVAVTSNASNASLGIALAGTGVTPGSLTASPSSVSFGSVQTGNSQTASETLTNSGGSSVTITQATATGSGFSMSGITLPVTLAAGQSTSFSVAFAPQTSGAASGGVAITSNASNATMNIGLSGTGTTPGTLAATQSSLSFGSVQVSGSAAASETITNTGGSSVTITQVNVTGTGFSAPGIDLPMTLTAGQSFTFSAMFAPQSAGAVTGSISVVSNASNASLAISLSGTGTAAGQLTISPTTLSFGSVTIGVGKSLTGSLSATGSSVTISSGTSSTSEFVLSGISFPLTIAAGQSASFTVTFTPQATGTASASATFASNASNTPGTESLTGTGAAAPQHQVALTWDASTSSVVGYNVYRGTAAGGPYTKVNSASDATTAYTDTSVTAGQSYYYLTTAVDSEGVESTYSNEVAVTVPTP
jgi:Abnormal spindle-like microcephaly-assoc'd, ASPM-SPD-2-Hydin